MVDGGEGFDELSFLASYTGPGVALDAASAPFASIERLGFQGGNGADDVGGTAVDDVAHRGFGDDNLEGRDGADSLFGNYGDDRLSGGSGGDCLDGGIDSLDGGDGNDIQPSLQATSP